MVPTKPLEWIESQGIVHVTSSIDGHLPRHSRLRLLEALKSLKYEVESGFGLYPQWTEWDEETVSKYVGAV